MSMRHCISGFPAPYHAASAGIHGWTLGSCYSYHISGKVLGCPSYTANRIVYGIRSRMQGWKWPGRPKVWFIAEMYTLSRLSHRPRATTKPQLRFHLIPYKWTISFSPFFFATHPLLTQLPLALRTQPRHQSSFIHCLWMYLCTPLQVAHPPGPS
jgi:hypothetical protein